MRGTTLGAAAIVAAALCLLPCVSARAQSARDSLIDTLDIPLAAERARNRISVTGATRSYDIGASPVTERSVSARYDLHASRLHVRIDGTSLRFTSPSTTIDGSLPLALRLNAAIRPGDTASVFVRTASRPLNLTEAQTSALSTAGTSALDLESAGLGTPSIAGARLTLAFPVGEMVLATRAGLEVEPRPGGSLPVYWRGTTMRGGVALTRSVGTGSLTASVDATHGTADSLGGRNLFPGGGSAILQLVSDFSLPNPSDPRDEERWPATAVAFYGRPFGDRRSEQPNLIIPQGDLVGALGSVLFARGDILFTPSIQVLREASLGESGPALNRYRISASAWTAQTGIEVTIPLGRTFELSPQASYTFGNVGASTSQSISFGRGPGITQTSSFNDAIRGRWISLQLSAVF